MYGSLSPCDQLHRPIAFPLKWISSSGERATDAAGRDAKSASAALHDPMAGRILPFEPPW